MNIIMDSHPIRSAPSFYQM